MRLLVDQGPGDFGVMEPDDDQIPRYAVLSHTWEVDGEEFLFKDLMEGTGKNKIGYKKVEFCGKEAAIDGLQHFWVDTCCIDKSSSNELSEAINSMFRWYKNASKCYVYLSDVSKSGHASDVQSSPATWEMAFRRSKWFSRGWTLQELIAPASVEFFSQEGERLGSKRSLEQHIHDVTGISTRALRGESLKGFGVEERLSWAKHRQTRRQEDKAYSLLGMFDIQMPLLYGEGMEKALVRLRKEIDTSDFQLIERGSGPSNIRSLTPVTQVRAWKPRYYFFYGVLASQRSIARSLELADPPVVYRAFLTGHSVAHLGKWKVLLNGPAEGIANGVAYKVEHEWHESRLILRESREYIPGPCIITILTGDGWLQIEGRTFKYYGSETDLMGVLPGASIFKDTVGARVG